MKLSLCFLLAMTACGSPASQPAPEPQSAPDASDKPSPVSDASPEADVIGLDVAVGDAGSLLCCSTNGGQNLLVCDASVPWTCGDPDAGGFPCSDPAAVCAVGATCVGQFGVGSVVVCGVR